jgi:hypothetical protein
MSTQSQKAFSGGEISPSLYARTDVAKYYTSVRKMRNMATMRHGGCQNRAGTKFICEVKDSTKTVRLIPFIFSRSVSYVLEFGNLYMRVIKNGAQVTNTAQNITGVTNANPSVLTYSGSDTYANGDEVYISGIVGPIGNFLNGRNFKVANVNTGANTFELNYLDGTAVNSTSFGAYTSGGTIAEVYTLTTTYLEADLQDLKFAQSADVMTIVHPSYPPRKLTRTADNNWSIANVNFVPAVNFAAVNGLGVTNIGTAGATTYGYGVTTFDPRTGEEGSVGVTSTLTGNATLSPTNFNRIAFTSLGDPYQHNVYRLRDGIYGFIGTCSGSIMQFDDIGYTPDYSDNPPTDRAVFAATDEYPSAVTYYQQRQVFANTNNNPENVILSGTGSFTNFQTSSPQTDADSIQFTLAGKLISEVYSLVDIGRLIVFTESGEWVVNGDGGGAITPTQINARQIAYNGSKPSPAPLVINDACLFIQSRGAIVRDLTYKIESDGYSGNDITIFASHLFDGKQIDDWSFQQVPNSILWAVRDDGKVIACTYLKEQQMVAWHQHDTENGLFQNVTSIPGITSQEDDVYFVIQRTINGTSKRYIEKMEKRYFVNIEDVKILDSHLSYDGRNTSSTSMTMSEYSGGGWLYTSEITLTASASYFSASDVGNEIHLTGSDGTIIRVTIDTYTSSTVVRGRPNATVPASIRSVAITDWAEAVDTVRGLWHLEGESVSVFADGYVVANPNNEAYTTVTVTNGAITLDRCYGVIHVGIPITADLETLNIDTAQGETLADKSQLVTDVSLFVEASRDFWAGREQPQNEDADFLGGLYQVKLRQFESYDEPVELKTEVVNVGIESAWNSNGRVFIRNTDPVPLTVLAVYPAGRFPFRG